MDNPIRIGVFRTIVMLVVMGAVSGNIFSLEIDSPEDLNMIQDLRQRILDQAQQLRSFKGRYRLHQTSARGEWQMVIEYRFQEGDVYLSEIEGVVPGRSEGDLFTWIRHKGMISVVGERFGDGGNSRKRWEVGRTWDLPAMAYLDPKILFCELYDEPAEQWLSRGTDTLHNRNGIWVFSSEANGGSVDVSFDESGRIRRIETVQRLTYPEDEIRKYWAGDLFDVRQVQRSWEFDGYTNINGVDFPALAISTIPQRDSSFAEELLESQRSGKMTEVEAWVRILTETPAQQPIIQTMELLDVTNVQVNVPLTDEDFTPDLPVGSSVYDVQSKLSYEIPPPHWYQRIPSDVWLAGVVVLVLTGAALAGWGAWRRYA